MVYTRCYKHVFIQYMHGGIFSIVLHVWIKVMEAGSLYSRDDDGQDVVMPS